ncbi:hypothetical protein ZWY2020_044595 [Hordeum vulgare]|nr:hypothetical protein ZWY2020_044595 [Hordeum vulgare]
MWSIRYTCHIRGYNNPEPEMIDRDFISYLDIKERTKELGFNHWNNVYYHKKGANGNSMVELTDDTSVMKMLQEFDAYKEIDLHVFRTMDPTTLLVSRNGVDSYKPLVVVPVEENNEEDSQNVELLSDVEYNDPVEYWRELNGQDYGTDSSDEDFDVVAETEKLRAMYAKKKEKELTEKGVYSEDAFEDLFDVTEGLDEFCKERGSKTEKGEGS